MVKINGNEYMRDEVKGVFENIVSEVETIDDLYNIDIEIESDNNLDVMCILEEIITEHAMKLYANEYDVDEDFLFEEYSDIKPTSFKSVKELIESYENFEEIIKGKIVKMTPE